ncbi:TenA family protein [Mycoplasma marinum]|uniref:Thiaminase-2/PQQC domain-containing protein n=1 Tax=Mycoplasma marinum TaxID=1937190 RepID=A0A4V2NI22_9MOLU|nr:hypothetical protein [Mycoplasma marinum]TCG11178.1 hypothetical protein C4B24_02750 [Mycoplasma marinum]
MGIVESFIKRYQQEWDEYTEHPIGKEIMNGTLEQELFVHYLEQDALYLKSYGECWKRLADLTQDLELKKYCLVQAKAVLEDELEVNDFYSCKSIENIERSAPTTKYIEFMEKYAKENNFNKLFFCLLACFIGYAAFAQKLDKHKKQKKYEKWIDIYCSEVFWENAKVITKIANNLGKKMTKEEEQEVGEIFKTTLILEKEFFDQGVSWKK